MKMLFMFFISVFCLFLFANPLYSEKVDSLKVKEIEKEDDSEGQIEEDIKEKIRDGEFFVKIVSDKVCECIDSIDNLDKTYKQVNSEIGDCIDKNVISLQMQDKLFGIDAVDSKKITDKKDTILVEIESNKESSEYKKYYMMIERYLMENCESIKVKVASTEKRNENSVSDNPDALRFYSLGIDEYKLEDYKKAIKYYKKAVTLDPNFAFAWDNMGLCYRILERYDDAIDCYKKSLEIDPNGLMPLQNLSIAYLMIKDFDNAVKTYEKLNEVDPGNPEVYFGLSKVYVIRDNDFEKALDYLCKSYNIYLEQQSPYRTDAENFISVIYEVMKKQNKEDKFNEILKSHNIVFEK